MMNKPRAGVMAGAVLAVAALAGCNPDAKMHARESASAATDFAKYTADICKRVRADSDATLISTTGAVSASRNSTAVPGQTELCKCDGDMAPTANPYKCTFTRAATPAGDGGLDDATISKHVALTAEGGGLRNAYKFTVADTGSSKNTQTIEVFAKGDDCKVNGVSIGRENCDAVRAAAINVVDAITTPLPVKADADTNSPSPPDHKGLDSVGAR